MATVYYHRYNKTKNMSSSKKRKTQDLKRLGDPIGNPTFFLAYFLVFNIELFLCLSSQMTSSKETCT